MEHHRRPNIRKFIASSELFGGYEVYIDLNYCNTLDDIVNIFHENLLGFLNQNNLREEIIKIPVKNDPLLLTESTPRRSVRLRNSIIEISWHPTQTLYTCVMENVRAYAGHYLE